MNDIDDYIRRNREVFSREALDARLRQSGLDQAAIDAAWSRVEVRAGAVIDEEPPDVSRAARVGAVLLILVAIAAYAYIGYVGLAGIAMTSYYDRGPDASSGLWGPYLLVAVAYVIAMLVGLGLSVRSLWRAPRIRGTGPAVFGAIGLTAILLIGINGVCFVSTGLAHDITPLPP